MKVLIIDDEPNVRLGLKVLIPWKTYDFEVIDEGIDGVDGLNKILGLLPDLVLIDIRMPGLSGLEVIENAKNQGYSGKFIITTGYSDFEYAKKAIHLGVSTYILKPIDEDELIEAITSIHKQIIEEKKQKEKLEISDAYVQKELMTNLILGKALSEYEKAKYHLLEKEKMDYCVAIIDISPKNAKPENVILEGVCEQLLHIEKIASILNFEEQVVMILESHGDIKKRLEKLQLRMEQNDGYLFKIALSSPVKGLDGIKQGYIQAKILLEKAFLFPEVKILTGALVEEEVVDKQYGDAQWLGRQFFTFIQVSDRSKLEEELEKLKMFFRGQNLHKEKITSICSNTFLNVVQYVADTYSEKKESLPLGEAVIEQIYQCKDINEVIQYIKIEFIRILEALQVSTPENTMEKIVYYIENNYSSELKLEYLANLFNYNSAYLGKSFKNYTGKSFNVYLDQVRINKAKELLIQGDLRVYEIAQMIGYKHMDYFHSKFKKYVGLSPLEYKKGEQNGCLSDFDHTKNKKEI